MESAELLRTMADQIRTNPIPSLQQTATRLNGLMAGGAYEIRDLSRAVLQDQGFTALVLHTANSTHYRRSHEQITTVTRAVLLLGEEKLRTLAVKAACADLVSMPDQVRRVAWRALLAASQAEALCGALRIADGERVVIRALLDNFGELAMAWYFPEQFAAIEERIHAKACARHEAYPEVLGVPIDLISQTVGEACGLPEGAVTGHLDDELTAVKQLAVALAERIEHAPESVLSDGDVQRMLESAGRRWPISASAIKDAMICGLDAASVCAKALGLDRQPAATSSGTQDEAEGAVIRPPSTDTLLGCIQDLAAYLTEPEKDFNTLVSYVLEGLYRGAGFDHVAVAFRVAGTNQFMGRASFGKPELHRVLSVSLDEPDLITECLKNGRPARFTDLSLFRTRLPKGMWQAVKPAWIAIGPLIVHRRTIGVVVASCRRVNAEQDELRWNGFSCLLAQAQAAFGMYTGANSQ
ncbi:MAG: HDOD domain-containing protein [Nitrospirota bacterium]